MLPNEKQKEIYLAGGKLAESTGDRLNTLKFYYLSGSWDNILSMPLTSYEIADIADESTKPMIMEVLELTPYETKVRHPNAIVPLAFTLFFLNEHQKLAAIQGEISSIIEESELPEEKKNALHGEMELLLSFLEYNRIDDMSKRHRIAQKLLRGPATLINIKSTWTFGSPSILYMYYRESGKLDEELKQMDECMPIYYSLTEGHGYGAETIMRGEAHFLRGEDEDAEILCHRGMFTADSKGQNSICQCSLFLLARIALLRKDKEMYENALKSMEERSKQNTEDLCRYTLDLSRGYLNLLLGNDKNLAPWLMEGDINDKRLVIMTQPFAYMIYCRLLIMKKDYIKLIGVCQYLIGISSIFSNMLPQIYANIYLAAAYKAIGKKTRGLEALKTSFAIALPDRIIIPFAENWEFIKEYLPDINNILDIETIRLIKELSCKLMESSSVIAAPGFEFTPREKEVIRLVKEGLSNKEIAAALFISVSTAKTLLGRIYEKTGVSTKTQLVLLDL